MFWKKNIWKMFYFLKSVQFFVSWFPSFGYDMKATYGSFFIGGQSCTGFDMECEIQILKGI